MNPFPTFTAAWRRLTGRRPSAPPPRRDAFAGLYGTGATAGFAGGAVGRLTASLASWSGSINADLDSSLVILRARARSLAANNEHGKRFLALVRANVVGRSNPKLQVRALRAAADPAKKPLLDKAANDAIEYHWERWGRTADITGRHKSIYSLMRTIIAHVARDGEAIVRKVRSRALPYGIGLQLLEPDRLDEGLNGQLANGNRVRLGVEVDAALRPLALWIKTAHPGENYATQANSTERVPIDDVFHLFLPERAEQVRGVTWLHAVILRAQRLGDFEQAAIIAAQVGASKIAALERATDAPEAVTSMADGTVGGVPQMKVEAGEMFELPAGYKLSSWNPEYPHANFDSFLKACLRGLAAGLDVAAHNLTGDMTDVNYSSARIAELAEREIWMMLQDWLIESFCIPLYEEWLALALLHKAITFPSGMALPFDRLDKFASAARFQGRRWAWVDPAKDAAANTALLDAKLTSRTRLAAEQGEEFDDILDELAAEAEAIDAAGLGAPPPADPAKSPDVQAADTAAKALVRAAELHRDGMRALAKAPAAPPVTVHAPISIQNRQPEQPAPVVNVAPADVQVSVAAPQVTVEPAAVEIRAELVLPEQPAPAVEVNIDMPEELRMAITAMPERRTDTAIERNLAGDIVKSTQTERDA